MPVAFGVKLLQNGLVISVAAMKNACTGYLFTYACRLSEQYVEYTMFE